MRPKPKKIYQPRAVKPAFELCELVWAMVQTLDKWEAKEKQMKQSEQLADLHDYAAEKIELAARNTINNSDGITIKFLLSVPGHSAGDVVTLAAAQARVYLKKNPPQAELYSYPA